MSAPATASPQGPPRPPRLARVLVALALFGVAFGYVEAAVVTYLRAIYDPMRTRLYPDRGTDLFPLITMEQLRGEGASHVHRLETEVAREAATLVMLAAVALAVGTNMRSWFAALSIVFGVWDVFFYVFLKVLIGWPDSLLAWDLLFLIPVPWVGPVLAPVLVSLSMIAAGVVSLVSESAGRPVVFRALHWSAVVLGGLLIVLAFCWDFRNTMAGGDPNAFHWPLFAVGLAVGLAAFSHAWLSSLGRS